jgi:hypothetical protein
MESNYTMTSNTILFLALYCSVLHIVSTTLGQEWRNTMTTIGRKTARPINTLVCAKQGEITMLSVTTRRKCGVKEGEVRVRSSSFHFHPCDAFLFMIALPSSNFSSLRVTPRCQLKWITMSLVFESTSYMLLRFWAAV